MRYTLIAADKSNQLSINIPEEIISKKVPLKVNTKKDKGHQTKDHKGNTKTKTIENP